MAAVVLVLLLALAGCGSSPVGTNQDGFAGSGPFNQNAGYNKGG
jgi:hypothetical protein